MSEGKAFLLIAFAFAAGTVFGWFSRAISELRNRRDP
jgi:hypothetical protein